MYLVPAYESAYCVLQLLIVVAVVSVVPLPLAAAAAAARCCCWCCCFNPHIHTHGAYSIHFLRADTNHRYVGSCFLHPAYVGIWSAWAILFHSRAHTCHDDIFIRFSGRVCLCSRFKTKTSKIQNTNVPKYSKQNTPHSAVDSHLKAAGYFWT